MLADLSTLPVSFLEILYTIVLPMLMLAGLGFLVQRRFGLDPATLTRLNFQLTIPALVYYSVLTSQIRLDTVAIQAGFTVLLVTVLLIVAQVVGHLRGMPADRRNALTSASIFYNSGNFGLPLQELAGQRIGHASDAAALQIVVMLIQNVGNFTIGVYLAAAGKRDRHWRGNFAHMLKFPPLYALAAALVTLLVRHYMTPAATTTAATVLQPFWYVITLLRNAFVPIALTTLGVQLAVLKTMATRYPVKTAVFLRLLISPAVALLLIWLLGVHGLVAQVLLIGSSTPTAVNAMLVAMEFDNHPEFLARAVFYSTLLSPVTVTLTVLLAQSSILPFMKL